MTLPLYRWTEHEKQIIREHYPTGGYLAVQALLTPDKWGRIRSKGAITSKAFHMGIESHAPKKYYPPTGRIYTTRLEDLETIGYQQAKQANELLRAWR